MSRDYDAYPPVPAERSWLSPVVVNAVQYNRRKDQSLYPAYQPFMDQAIRNRWGLGPVWDTPWGPEYDLVPPATGRYAEFFPPAPVFEEDAELTALVLGSASRRFGADEAPKKPLAAIAALFQKPDPTVQAQATSLLNQAQSTVQNLAHPQPRIVYQSPIQQRDTTTRDVAGVLAVAAAAFGAGFLFGKSRHERG